MMEPQDLEQAKSRPAVLIVDDSLTVRMDLREVLEPAGFAIILCESLAAARAAIAGQSFSLVILDVLLPDGDGVDFLSEIKSDREPSVPVILLSTEAEVRDRVRGLQTGADDYVGKPYDSGYILARALQLTGSREKDGGRTKPSILLIDDSATFRAEFQPILEQAGHSVTTAASGEEGLNAAFALRPDAIIVDLVLPGEVDGLTVIQRIKQDITLRNTPCLLLTASVDSNEERSLLEAGADAFLSKDTDVSIILARLTGLLRSAGPSLSLDASASSLLGAKKILAVDDSITFLNEVSLQLRAEGYDVVQVSSGKEALELLKVQAADCVLLDVRMPELSGIETCRIIKQNSEWRNIPLLMLTSADEADAVVEGINAGADDYISKSNDFAVLKARVRAQLRRKQFEDEYRAIRDRLMHKELDAAQARATQEIAEARAAMIEELEQKNRELEAFTYAVSHDLRAPLRTIRGFTQALLDDFGAELPAGAHKHLDRVSGGVSRMTKLIDALLELSRSGQSELHREQVDLSALARSVASELDESNHGRRVDWVIAKGLVVEGDAALIRVAFNNLLGNAWKFTGRTTDARIEIGVLQEPRSSVYFVRDNGVGFDSKRAKALFQPFERLHAATEFPGAGIGLATVRRIFKRHGGNVWAESTAGAGATFFFTFGPAEGVGEAAASAATEPSGVRL